MTQDTTFEIAVLPGDGIGREVTPAAVTVLEAVAKRIGGLRLHFTEYAARAQHYALSGTPFPTRR